LPGGAFTRWSTNTFPGAPMFARTLSPKAAHWGFDFL
jgi:hypothetical protein